VNIREMIERLHEIAQDLPDGLDSKVQVHICNGGEAEGVVTREVNVATRRLQNDVTLEIKEIYALVQGHPHLDDGNTVVGSMTRNLDDELARLTGEEPRFKLPPGTKSVTIDLGDGKGRKFPLDSDGKVIAPGSSPGLKLGCRCDPAKNNDGRGIAVGNGVHFIMHNDCPVHPWVDSSSDLWVIE